MISILLLAAWTLLIVRLLASRATLGSRAFLTYLIYGGLLGAVVAPLNLKFVLPYPAGQDIHYQTPLLTHLGPFQGELYAALTLAVLLLPVLAYLYSNRIFATISVADAFLLGFMVGFGFDLVGSLLTATTTSNWPGPLSFFPPGQMTMGGIYAAGNGFWCGLIAMTMAATLRFVRPPRWAWVATGLVFLWCATEQAADQAQFAWWLDNSFDRGLLDRLGAITAHGAFTAWIALVALVALSVREARWVSQVRGQDSEGAPGVLPEARALMSTLISGHLGEFSRQARLFAVRRQVRLVRAEVAHSPRDPILRLTLSEMQKRLAQAESAGSVEDGLSLSLAARSWLRSPELLVQIVVCVAVVVLGLVLPALSADKAVSFWNLAPFQWLFAAWPVTFLTLLLMIGVVWRFLTSPDRPDMKADPDDALQFQGERAMIVVALAVAFLALALGRTLVGNGNAFAPEVVPGQGIAYGLETIWPPPSLTALYVQAQPAHLGSSGAPVANLFLLFAFAATGLIMRRSARLRFVPRLRRREVLIRNGSSLVLAGIAFLVVALLYDPTLTLIQSSLGATFYDRWAHTNGNTAAALVAGLVMAILGVVLVVGLRTLSRRLQAVLLREDSAGAASQPSRS